MSTVKTKMENNKYSVLMSIYSKEEPKFFKESIESMLAQTLLPEQIVIVKDGPLTRELDLIIDEYTSRKEGLFTIVPLTKNIGLGKALDKGLEACENELIARMDTDDISLPERCEKQVQAFNKDSELSIVGAMIDEFYDEPSNIVSSRNVPTNHEEIVKFMRR